MDAEGGFFNDAELATSQDPASGGFSSPDVTIVHNGIHHHCDWTPLDSLSSDHRPILTTLHLPSQQRKGPKRLVWNWKKGNISAYTADLEKRLSQNSSDENASITSAYESFCTVIFTTAKSHIGLKAADMAGESWRTEISQAEIERDTARATSSIQSEQYKDQDAHLKRLVRERKAEIWERKVMKERELKRCGRSSASSPQTKSLTLLVSSPKNCQPKAEGECIRQTVPKCEFAKGQKTGR